MTTKKSALDLLIPTEIKENKPTVEKDEAALMVKIPMELMEKIKDAQYWEITNTGNIDLSQKEIVVQALTEYLKDTKKRPKK